MVPLIVAGRKLGTMKQRWIESGVNEQLEPFVHLRVQGEIDGDEIVLLGQLSPAELRTQALGDFRVAETAEADAMTAAFFMRTLEMTLEDAMTIVFALREHRTQALADLSIITETIRPDDD